MGSKRPRVNPLEVVVAGSVGTGKSTAVKGLTGDPAFVSGDEGEGVTKDISAGTFRLPRSNIPVKIRDPPGIGDSDVKPFQLMNMYQTALEGVEVKALLLFFDCTKPRFDMGGEMLLRLMDICFPGSGEDRWKNFICVGTHKDEATAKKIEAFEGGHLLKAFKKAVPGVPDDLSFITVGKGDYDQLHDKLESLIDLPPLSEYQAPGAKDFVNIIAKSTGVDEEAALSSLASAAATDPSANAMIQMMMENDRKKGEEHAQLVAMLQQQITGMQQQIAAAAARPAEVRVERVPVPQPVCAVM